jgi:hypothetical protein
MSLAAQAKETATIVIQDQQSTGHKQILVLEKEKKDFLCFVERQPRKKMTGIHLKTLAFPLPESKSLNSCKKTISWTYKKKTKKGCYTPLQDGVIDDILFNCYN